MAASSPICPTCSSARRSGHARRRGHDVRRAAAGASPAPARAARADLCEPRPHGGGSGHLRRGRSPSTCTPTSRRARGARAGCDLVVPRSRMAREGARSSTAVAADVSDVAPGPRRAERAQLLGVGDRVALQLAAGHRLVGAHPPQRRRVGVDRHRRAVAGVRDAVDVRGGEVDRLAGAHPPAQRRRRPARGAPRRPRPRRRRARRRRRRGRESRCRGRPSSR